ncbi:HVA22-like protein e isoform X2 [Phalaenopsis equestris]|uniref:HVA22-like protein e isoform X2 n=1 Tax=Phalaenopsis equestris TaxID=78828 RepID=UPI0009E3945E|nr:HVA22-like protein e isoform X2 [Phalaenopsis equestris]
MAQLWTILTQLYAIAGPCVMLLYPLYASVEAIESPSKVDDEQWLAYWIIYSFLTLFEMVAEPLLAWIPIWYPIKFMFVTWLVLPQLRGSAFIYNKVVREQLRRYGYGPYAAQKKAEKEVSNLSSPNKVRNKFLRLARSKKVEQERS